MNFYKAQDQARKQTSWLLILYFLSVVSIVIITNVCFAIFVWYSNPSNLSSIHLQPITSVSSLIEWFRQIVISLGWYKFLWVTGLVCGVIGMSMAFKWASLRHGGRVVAESLGGRLLAPNTEDLLERRLLNVVEEIALASGIPVPPVYIMDNEKSINAFAAGLSYEDAVIGVTCGTLECLSREQLQGVIAHEFSHILNGDMLLNMKMLAVLHGILMISEAGRTIMRHSSRRSYSRSRRDVNGGFFIFGLCLFLIGWLGQLFGDLIKSAVSRQREFLADASAVQFTRNPEGIGGALKIIGGYGLHSNIQHSAAHEVGHLFFSSAYKSFLSLFSTHPPLEMRINRVLPSWNGRFTRYTKQSEQDGRPIAGSNEAYASFNGGQSGASDQTAESVTKAKVMGHKSTSNYDGTPIEFMLEPSPNTQVLHEKIPAAEVLFQQAKALAHEPLGAVSLVLAMLMQDDATVLTKQLVIIERKQKKWLQPSKESKRQLDQLHAQSKVSGQHRLQLLEVAIPSLKQMSLKQYLLLREIIKQMVHADGRIALFEWVTYQLVCQYCDRHFGLSKVQKPKYKTIKHLLPIYEIVLSRVVHYGGGQDDAKLNAFNKACNVAGTYTIKLLPIELCSQAKFTRAIHALGQAYPLLKPRLIKGLIGAAQTDTCINDSEHQVIRGIAAVMDCPLIGLEL
ncbi:MAG: Zn-dependent protease with chaperone function [Oleiphilaceae bacterium]|jgi:Zn-dependent protease with chaperone function/uncharacterized tellurite resistance protein B-like protein